MHSWKRAAASLAFLAVAGSVPLMAQSSATASIAATAVVAGQQPIAVAGNQNMLFGSTSTPVNAGGGPFTPTQDGLFTVTGEPSFPFFVNFTLPSALTDAVSGNSINITFGANDGLDWTDFSTGTLNTTFDPRNQYSATLSGTGVKEIGLQGTINPPLGTVSGTYTATVTIDVNY